jgi:manganese/zinc/iron transport system permease protein
VLRRESLLGDAISHAVLPGIVLGFLIAGTRATLPILAGAAAASLLCALLIQTIRRVGRIEQGASMGVVFTVMFASGVLLIEQASVGSIDIDPDCVLYGQLEDVLWLSASGWGSFLDPSALADLPRELLTLAGALAASAALVALFWKEIRVVSFDPAFALASGMPIGIVQYGLAGLVALAAVASFEAVGSILVIAALICPAATARLLTDRYGRQLALSVLFGAASAILGYVTAAWLPGWLGAPWALNVAGMIAVIAGLFLAFAVLFAPRYGVLAQGGRPRAAAVRA